MGDRKEGKKLRGIFSYSLFSRQSRKVVWDMINTLFLTYCSCRTYFCCLRKRAFMASRAIPLILFDNVACTFSFLEITVYRPATSRPHDFHRRKSRRNTYTSINKSLVFHSAVMARSMFLFLAYELCLNSWTYSILSFSRTFCSTI